MFNGLLILIEVNDVRLSEEGTFCYKTISEYKSNYNCIRFIVPILSSIASILLHSRLTKNEDVFVHLTCTQFERIA